jgi:hypothetical protein
MEEERSNLTQEDVLSIVSQFPLEPMFNKVYITLNKEAADGDLILSDNVLSEIQYVVAGEIEWRDKRIAPGQKVIIDIEKMMVPVRQESRDSYETVMQVRIDPVEIDGNMYALIEDRFIKAKDNR